jgi:hypothetical protein
MTILGRYGLGTRTGYIRSMYVYMYIRFRGFYYAPRIERPRAVARCAREYCYVHNILVPAFFLLQEYFLKHIHPLKSYTTLNLHVPLQTSNTQKREHHTGNEKCANSLSLHLLLPLPPLPFLLLLLPLMPRFSPPLFSPRLFSRAPCSLSLGTAAAAAPAAPGVVGAAAAAAAAADADAPTDGGA